MREGLVVGNEGESSRYRGGRGGGERRRDKERID